MQSVAVPTNPDDVKKALRYIEEPITLFGEREVRSLVPHVDLTWEPESRWRGGND